MKKTLEDKIPVIKPVLKFNCPDSQKAWEDINEFMFIHEDKLKKAGAGRDGNVSIAYDVFMFIEKAWVDPSFDFGMMFGHRIQKWTHLVKNYVDMNYLNIVREDIQTRESKKQKVYQVTKHFSNSFDNGKDCLISLTFSRRLGNKLPVLIFHIRASEITKRLLWDFLLVQRMGEYVYGNNEFSIILYCPMAYLNAEAFTMYHNHVSIKKLLKSHYGKDYKNCLQPFQQRVLGILNKFLRCDPMSISYKSHRRAVKQLQKDENGKPISGDRPLLAGDLFLQTNQILYPADCITEKQKTNYRKELRNKNKYDSPRF